MLIKLSIILLSNSYNFAYYAHRFYLLPYGGKVWRGESLVGGKFGGGKVWWGESLAGENLVN